MSEGTARNKLPLTGGVSIPELRQPPPIQQRLPTTAKVVSAYDPSHADEDKTTAYKVPEELLHRARTGFVPSTAVEDKGARDKGPDSGAITAPPPAQAQVDVQRVAPRAPGVPQDLLMSLLRAAPGEEEEVTVMRPSTAYSARADETDADAWYAAPHAEFPLVSRTIEGVGCSSDVANDARPVRVPTGWTVAARPGVSPVVLWLAVASLTVAAAVLVWLVR